MPGACPAVMREVRDLLHLDCLTVTGKTLGENLEEIERTFYFETELPGQRQGGSAEIIRPRSDPFGRGGVAVLRGQRAPRGAVIKHFSVPREMHAHRPGAVFDTEDLAVEALPNAGGQAGDVVVIRYPRVLRANGMPEMYYATAIIAASKELTATCAVVTDGRYSGA